MMIFIKFKSKMIMLLNSKKFSQFFFYSRSSVILCSLRFFSFVFTLSEVAQSCPTLCDPKDCSPPGSSVHEIFQAKVLEWVAISFSR